MKVRRTDGRERRMQASGLNPGAIQWVYDSNRPD
jgi:hypothetical protein